MDFDKTLQVKQWVACVKGHDEQGRETGRFAVLATGSAQHYLFHKLDPRDGTFTGISFPVRKSDLRDDVRRALAHGYGNCGMRASEDGVPFRFLPPGATWRPTEETCEPMTPDDPLAPLCAAAGAYSAARLARAAAEKRSDEANRALDAAREDERRARAAVEALRAPSPEGAFTSPEILAGCKAADERAAAAPPVEPAKPRRRGRKPATVREHHAEYDATIAARGETREEVVARMLADAAAPDAAQPEAPQEAPAQQRPAGELFAADPPVVPTAYEEGR